ncbi:MAG: 16S rRNA (guanine(966)-N(2))-methyltransferase RsmD [Bacillota bacterium]
MRVISGKHRGRILHEFKGKDIRPTSDRAKEAIFSILQNDVNGMSFLDLFAGSGSVGIEALSRGAGRVVFCDKEKFSCDLVKANLKLLNIEAEVLLTPALFGLNRFITRKEKFNVIFLDPPYKTKLGVDAVEIIDKNKLITENGMVIYEYAEGEKHNINLENLVEFDTRRYGKAVFSFFEYKREEESEEVSEEE